MRQAGRYLPEYRELRARAGSFMALCKSPELACQVTLQPLGRFDLDAAIIFSDILTIPDAMGLRASFIEGQGAQLDSPIRCAEDVDKLPEFDPTVGTGYVMDAIRTTRAELAGSVPLIGFAGSPWTLATYMVEGRSGSQNKVRALLFEQPHTTHRLLSKLADAVARYLCAQVDAGAQTLVIFDTWGGTLSTSHYRDCSLEYVRQIIAYLRQQAVSVPVVLFTKHGGQWLSDMSHSGADALGIDWHTELSQARAQTEGRVALQGNLDPCALYGTPDTIRQEVARVLQSYGHGPGHVFNLGHGIAPDVPPEHVAALVQAVADLSPPYHKPIT